MALYVKDAEVDMLAERVASAQNVSKTEAVRRALIHELRRTQPNLVERGVAFARALRASAPGETGQSADKDFIDGLYGDL
jgi:antitoxin VapB